MNSYMLSVLKTKFDKKYTFLTCASFEDRSLAIPKNLDIDMITNAVVFTTKASDLIMHNCNEMEKIFNDKISIVEIENNNPFSYFDKFLELLDKEISLQHKRLVIDISTFTHEMLLILLKLLNQKKDCFIEIKFLYVGAKEYSIGNNPEEKWLSKGCKVVRNVLGYPGVRLPTNPICLTVLVGFEHERANALVKLMDPEKLFIGHGYIDETCVYSKEHMLPMQHFNTVYKMVFSGRSNVKSFDFCVNDIDDTRSIIQKIISENPNYDHIIVPMNTKTSTIAVGLIALDNPNIQICYAEPEYYNEKNYSKSGESFVEFGFGG